MNCNLVDTKIIIFTSIYILFKYLCHHFENYLLYFKLLEYSMMLYAYIYLFYFYFFLQIHITVALGRHTKTNFCILCKNTQTVFI